MKRVLFSMVLLMAVSFTFAQQKSVKEAKGIASDVKPDFKKAEQLINGALTNPETKDDAATWDVAASSFGSGLINAPLISCSAD